MILLSYALDKHHQFTEKITLHGPTMSPLTTDKQNALSKIIDSLHILAGTSYYKTYLPAKIGLKNQALNANQASFFKKMYDGGLGEFAYRNNIDLAGKIHFPVTNDNDSYIPASLNLKDRALVLIGGGKDSLVSIESLRASGKDITLFAVNPKKPILECIEHSGLPAITVTRTLDPLLMQLNDEGAYNGHVPITSILSFIAMAAAIIFDYNAVILSNERSASEATLQHNGTDINHQYSKSLSVEQDIQTYVQNYAAPDLNYFSFLRPFSELHIARALSKTSRYDDVFTSCNKAFRLNNPMVDKRWCGDCPKCQFVFLALSTTFDKSRLTKIIGKNMLDDSTQIEAYRNLSGLTGHKPWECVGEIMECASSIHQLSKDKAWQNDLVVKTLAPELLSKYGAAKLEQEFDQCLTPAPDHHVPPQYQEAFEWLS